MSAALDRVLRLRAGNAWLYGTMLVSAVLSLVASFVLSVDAVRLAADPSADLSCNINAVVSCGTVGRSWQAHLLGFPNAFLGLIAEPVVITLAVAGLGGVRFPRWFMLAAQAVYAIGVGFAYWLFYESTYVIGALCPWCLLVTVSTTLVFATLTHINVRDGHLRLPGRAGPAVRAALAAGLDAIAVTVWLLALTLVVVLHYGNALLG